MQSIKLSVSQKKIIIISLVVVIVFLFFLFFVYLPIQNTLIKIKSELLSKEKEIQGIQAAVSLAKTQEEGIRLLRERFQRLDNKFPRREEESLGMLSDLARKSNVELISIKPGPKKAFLDENNNKVETEGMSCQSVLVSIEMRCLYKDLVRYIQDLKESLPAFVTIEALKIDKDASLTLKLNIVLSLNLYLLS